MKLQGVYISVVAPFDHRGQLWDVKIEHNVAKWNRTSISGYVIGDESLSSEEKTRLLELVTKFADGKAAFAERPDGNFASDANFAEALKSGAQGVISSIANAAPYTMISIWEAHRTRDTEAAADWQNRIAKAIEVISGSNGAAALKYAMDLNGYYGGPSRLPATVLTPDQKKAVEQAFAGIKG